ncbi:uncharacterized protein IL334_006501 [Kwoniella shivajii]|uniref:F-box domain-containing protein n=1 Tax=Kwoniella shivajii TaxID=564305 RepID=A0ABZ1D816_9TREE|nr:hypothetical protein IL334_006501 [Kwoniella shivajii]
MRKILSNRFFKRRTDTELSNTALNPNVPADLFSLIVTFVSDQHTLFALTLTNKHFNQLAAPMLYQEVRLSRPGAFKLFVKSAPAHRKQSVQTLDLTFNVRWLNIDLERLKKKYPVKIAESRLYNLKKLVVISKGAERHSREIGNTRFTNHLITLVIQWIKIFCPIEGPNTFRGRHYGQDGREGEVLWAKSPLFEMINQWSRTEHVDLPIIPHTITWGGPMEISGLPHVSGPLPTMKKVTMHNWNSDRLHEDGCLLAEWLDSLENEIILATEDNKLGRRVYDGEMDQRVILSLRDPISTYSRYRLEDWIKDDEDRSQVYRIDNQEQTFQPECDIWDVE